MGKILRRCDVFKNWGAAYLLPNPDSSTRQLCPCCCQALQVKVSQAAAQPPDSARAADGSDETGFGQETG